MKSYPSRNICFPSHVHVSYPAFQKREETYAVIQLIVRRKNKCLLTPSKCPLYGSLWVENAETYYSIPNREVRSVWESEVTSLIKKNWNENKVDALSVALSDGDSPRIKSILENFLMESVSFMDTAKENFYHGLVLGLTALFSDYAVRSNRESGEGRYDIMLSPEQKDLPGIIIEVKAGKDLSEEQLDILAERATAQIEDLSYATELRASGVRNIINYGVAFSGKHAAVHASQTGI